jgi:hypothetical protein
MSVTPDPAAAACYLSVRSDQDGFVFYCIAVMIDDGVNALGDLVVFVVELTETEPKLLIKGGHTI